MYEELTYGDVIKFAGHNFDRRTSRCTVNKLVDGDLRLCNRHINDVLSDAEGAAVGAEGIACVGKLNSVELEQVQLARESRRKAIERAF